MNLKKLKLTNLRSFEKADFEFDQTSIIIGLNATGKTNIFEAIQVLSLGKSTRGSEESELIKFGADFVKIEGKTDENELEVRIILVSDRLSKRFFVNNIARRLADYIGNLRLVVFSPTDLDLVTDSPGLRRDHLDNTLSQIDRIYHKVVSSYERALRSRNKLLLAIMQQKAKKDELQFWDESLVKLGSFITRKREEMFLFLNNLVSEFGNFSWKYRPNVATSERILESFTKDLQTRTTNVGPHRDEFRFLLDKQDLGLFGSRGEQRLGVLALKLAELEYISLKTGARPILLLDDIFSELDLKNRMEIGKIIASQQTILTTTDIANMDRKLAKTAKIIEI